MKQILLSFLIISLLAGIFGNANAQIPKYLLVDFDENEFNTQDIIDYIDYGSETNYYRSDIKLKYDPSKQNSKLMSASLNQYGMEITNIIKAARPGDGIAQAETWITINPNDPLNVIATSNDGAFGHNRGYQMSAYHTKDGGKTWKVSATPSHSSLITGPGSRTIFDPAIEFNSKGEALYVYGFTSIINSSTHPEGGIYMTNSTDGGETWRDFLNDEIGENQIAFNNESVFNDRYTVAVDINSDDPKLRDKLYVAWQRFASSDNNGGINVSASREKDDYLDHRNYHIGGGGTQAPYPITGPDGELYVSWRGFNGIKTSCPIQYSEDGGKSFVKRATMAVVYTSGTQHPESGRYVLKDKKDMRVSSNPVLAVDCTPKGSVSRGIVYGAVTGRLENNNHSNIVFCKSTDKGLSWTTKAIENTKLDTDIFFPALTVDNTTGYIHLFYYSSQEDPTNQKVDGFYAISKDQGNTFKHFRLTDESMSVNPVGQGEAGNLYWGDYTGICASQNRIYPLFWMPTGGGASSLDLFTALITTSPLPPYPIKATSEQTVIINWGIPTDGVLDPIENYSIELWKNNKLLKTFDEAASSYTDADIKQGELIKYKIRTISEDVRGTGDFYEFDVKAGGNIEPLAASSFTASPSDNGILLSWINPKLTTDGNEFKFFNAVNVYIDGKLETKILSANVQSNGAFSTYELVVETNKFYENISIEIEGKRGENIKVSKNNPKVKFAYAGAVSLGLNLSFESAFDSYGKLEFGDTQWQLTDAKASEGSYSLTDSDVGVKYTHNLNDGFILAPFVLDGGNVNLHWKFIALVHKDDHASIAVSNNHGKSWNGGFWMNNTYDPSFEGDLASANWADGGLNLPDYGFKTGDTVYIRIKMVSNIGIARDGIYIDEIELNNVLSVRDDAISTARINPNPVQNNATVNFELKIAGQTRLEVYNNLGNRVLDLGNQFYGIGQNNKTINMTSLGNGVYYLRISQNNSSENIPFVISK